MKKNLKTLFVSFLVMLSVAACKKKPSENPIEDLPPFTQEGKNTFGCLINGKLFLPKKRIGSSGSELTCRYQYLWENFNPVKGYFFHLSAANTKNEPQYSIYLNSANKALSLGEHNLHRMGTVGEFSGGFATFTHGEEPKIYEINATQKGKLKITKHDEVNNIVSGTFSFDAFNQIGEKVEVREGRFDMRY